MSAGRSKALAVSGALATALVLLAATVRNHRLDASAMTLALALPPPSAASVANPDFELQPEDMQLLGAQAPETGIAPLPQATAAGQIREQPPAVVTAATAPATVRKVIVGKGKRVVRQVPVTPRPTAPADPPTRTARFDMSQGGKRMTADEFDAWMKAQGIRVATGAAKPATPQPTPAVTTPAPAATCTPEPGKSC